jgi:hypothetical protein
MYHNPYGIIEGKEADRMITKLNPTATAVEPPKIHKEPKVISRLKHVTANAAKRQDSRSAVGPVIRIDKRFAYPALFPMESLDFEGERDERTDADRDLSYKQLVAGLTVQDDDDLDIPLL